MSQPVEGVVVCPSYASSCHCGLPPDHDGPHECVDQERCGGQWTGSDATGDVTPVRFPAAGGIGDALNALLEGGSP